MAIDRVPNMTGMRFKPQGEMSLSRDSLRRSTLGHAANAKEHIPSVRDEVAKGDLVGGRLVTEFVGRHLLDGGDSIFLAAR